MNGVTLSALAAYIRQWSTALPRRCMNTASTLMPAEASMTRLLRCQVDGVIVPSCLAVCCFQLQLYLDSISEPWAKIWKLGIASHQKWRKCLEARLGFCPRYQLRRHKNEDKINNGVHWARQDWHRYIGPTDVFGNANPYHGNFTSLVLPFTLPDRVEIIAYFLECKLSHIADHDSNLMALQMRFIMTISASLPTKRLR